MFWDVVKTTAIRVILIIIGLAFNIITARALGPANRGIYYFVCSLSMVIVQFSFLGLTSSNTYIVAKRKALLGKLASNSIIITLFVGGISSIVCALFYSFFSDESNYYQWFLLLMVPSSIFFTFATNLFVGISNIKLFNIYNLAYNALAFIFGVIGLLLYNSVISLLVASSLNGLIISIMLFCSLNKLCKIELKFNFKIFKSGFFYALKSYINTLFALLILRSQVFVLGYYCTDSEIGQYSIAAQLSETMIIMPQVISLILFPKLVTMATEQRWKIALKNSFICSFIMLFGALAAILFARPMIIFCFGENYSPAVTYLLYMQPGIICLSFANILNQYLAAEGMPIHLSIVWFITLIISVITSILLVPNMGAIGSGISLSICYFSLAIMVLIMCIYNNRKTTLLAYQTGEL